VAESSAPFGLAIRCSRVAPGGLLSVRTDHSAWIGDALGVRWQDQMLCVHQQADLRWWSVSPSVWLIELPRGQAPVVWRVLDTASRRHAGLVTDISDSRQVLRLSGDAASLNVWLERALAIEPGRLSGNAAVATRLGAFAVTMTGDPASGSIEISVERSLAESLEAWVERLRGLSR